MYKTISSFNDVEITNSNTLVICDIDETLLTWNKKSSDFYHVVIDNLSSIDCATKPTPEEIYKEALLWLNMYCEMFAPVMTDDGGFHNLLYRIEKSNSEIMFLTARPKNYNSNNFTRKNFLDIGLDYDKYSIHYTNNNSISKGEYIKKNINTSNDKYNQIIFIDDYETYIKTVNDILPNIVCYKFEVDYEKLSLK